MRASMTLAVMTVVGLAICVGLASCEGDTRDASSASSTETGTESTSATKPEKTISDYIKENHIVETPVLRGDAGTPGIELPVPPGWADAGRRAPEGAYDAMTLSGPANAADSPTLIAYVAKLAGNVDAAKILEYAPAEIQQLPGYEGPEVGGATKVGGFDATQIGGAYVKSGVKRAVGQMTVVIPGKDGLFVLQLNAESLGKPEQVQALTVATGFVAQQARITP